MGLPGTHGKAFGTTVSPYLPKTFRVFLTFINFNVFERPSKDQASLNSSTGESVESSTGESDGKPVTKKADSLEEAKRSDKEEESEEEEEEEEDEDEMGHSDDGNLNEDYAKSSSNPANKISSSLLTTITNANSDYYDRTVRGIFLVY